MATKTYTIIGAPISCLAYGADESDPEFTATKRGVETMLKQLRQEGVSHFLCCPYTIGWDFWAMEIAVGVATATAHALRKRKLPDNAPPPVCGLFLPYQGFEEMLPGEYRQRYTAVLASPFVQPRYSGLPGQQALSLYKTMLDVSDGLVCIGLKRHRHLAEALDYARAQGRETYRLSPAGGRLLQIE